MPKFVHVKGNTSLIPSACKIDECTITNQQGDWVDVTPLITNLEVEESLYSPALTVTVEIKDEGNVFGALPIYGLESIKLRINRGELAGKGGVLNYVFAVTDIPVFGRNDDVRQHSQAWSIRGITMATYASDWKRVSRYYGFPLKIIDDTTKLIRDYLGPYEQRGISSQTGQGVIPYMSPVKAINFLNRGLLEDGTKAPFYFYTHHRKPDVWMLHSHQKLVNSGPHYKYWSGRGNNREAYTPEDYLQRKTTLVSSGSEINEAKYKYGHQGAWGSENVYFDPSLKLFEKQYYGYTKGTPIFPINSTIYKKSLFLPPASGTGGGPRITKEEPANAVANASAGPIAPSPENEYFFYQEFITQNSLSFGKDTYNDWRNQGSQGYIPIKRAWSGSINAIIHDITIFGEINMIPGEMVQLNFSGATDPDGVETLDVNLSGKYLITTVLHRWTGVEYYTIFRAKRDSHT